jgi:hypothetical protein
MCPAKELRLVDTQIYFAQLSQLKKSDYIHCVEFKFKTITLLEVFSSSAESISSRVTAISGVRLHHSSEIEPGLIAQRSEILIIS